MTVLPYVVDGTAENFPRLVLENSRRGPVVVNFWSSRAGPCLVAMPRVVRVAEEYGGQLLVVMLNTDDYGELARRLDVHALPMLKVFHRGVVVDTLQGVRPEAELRTLFSKYGTRLQGDSLFRYEDRPPAQALEQAAQDALARPEDPETALRVAKLLVLDKRPDQAFSLLEALPPPMRSGAEIAALYAHLALIAAMNDEVQEETSATACSLFVAAAHALRRDDFEGACSLLLQSYDRDPAYRDGLALGAARALQALPMAPVLRARLHAMLPADMK